MIEPGESPSRWVVGRPVACWLAAGIVFATLLLAVCAQARASTAIGLAGVTPTGEATSEGNASSEETPPAGEETKPAAETPPAGEEAKPAKETPPAGEEAKPAEETPPAGEEAKPKEEPPAEEETKPTEEPPPVSEETPPAEQPSPPAEESKSTEQAPPAAEETPAAEQTDPTSEAPPVAEEPAPAKQAPHEAEEAPLVVEKQTVEPAAPAAAGTGLEASAIQATQGDSQTPTDGSGLAPDGSGEVVPAAAVPVTASDAPLAASEIAIADEHSSQTQSAGTISTRCGGQVSCELEAIEASVTGGYAGGWLDVLAGPSISTAAVATIEVTPAAITPGAPAGSQALTSAVAQHPSAPSPGPVPGGAGGGSAAGGGTGSASSAPFTLVTVQIQAAPGAMRRMRLAQPSWRTASFVLIPERPD